MKLAAGNTLNGERVFFPITDEDRTEMFRIGPGDTMSLLYRVNSTDKNCVEPGNINLRVTLYNMIK